MSYSSTTQLEGVRMLAAMLAALCRTAPAVIGMSWASTYCLVSLSWISSSTLSSKLDSEATDQFVEPTSRYGCL